VNSPASALRSDNAAQPDLRQWLRQLAATDRLAVAKNGISLIDELAAISKKLENDSAVLFPAPAGHDIPVVANLFIDRRSVADAVGVPVRQLLSRFQSAVRRPLPWVEVKDAAHPEAQ
jgi:2,5-furandicarboxylate decarboxylase 1